MLLAIVLPAYNEEKVLARVLSCIPARIQGISKIITIVVDDGSSDATYSIGKKHATYCIKHKINLGVGSATITGIVYAKRYIHPDILVSIDSDGQHDPKEIPIIIRPIQKNRADVVIGSRLIKSSGMPLLKVATNKFASLITYLFSGIWVTDSQSGFRAYSAHALQTITIKTTGYEYCTEVISEIQRHHLRYLELPIKVIYNEYSNAKGQPIINSVNIIIRLIIKKIST